MGKDNGWDAVEDVQRVIKSISLEYPNTEFMESLSYTVGKNVYQTEIKVTEIKKISKSPEPYCSVDYYEIWCGDDLIAEMHQYGHIQYFTQAELQARKEEE